MFENIRQDIAAKRKLNKEQTNTAVPFIDRGLIAVMAYRFGRWANTLPVPVVKQLFKVIYYVLFYLVQMFTNISIQAYAKIGNSFVVNRYGCIFVLAESIGDNFTVCEGVTVGNIRGQGRLPIIGDNVYLEPGCKILGSITIGNNVVVRANSFIVADIPDNSIAIGNPARIIPNET